MIRQFAMRALFPYDRKGREMPERGNAPVTPAIISRVCNPKSVVRLKELLEQLREQIQNIE